MARVQLEHVSKKYGDVTAVSNLSMDVRDGELLALLGPSGCGKSTVLRLIAGLETLTSGNIYMDGQLVNNVPPGGRNLALVFESPSHALYPNMTVYDNMAFGLRIRKEPLEDATNREAKPHTPNIPASTQTHSEREEGIRKRVEQVAGRLGLQSYLGRKRDQLSAGHSQSAALGRALVRHPRLLLMDDPLSQLDAQAAGGRRAELKRLHKETGATILYVTHDQAEATSLGDRIAVMDNGVLQQIDTSQSLYNHPANMFVAGFIGSPSMNLLQADVEGPGGTLLSGRGFTVVMPPYFAERLTDRQQVVLGISPENIKDARLLPDADPLTVVSATVELVENTGSDLFVHLSAGGGPTFVARLGVGTHLRPGQQMDLVFDMAKMHAFDPVSGLALV